MNKICTSLEQSKKFIELGIDVNTSDMMYVTLAGRKGVKTILISKEVYNTLITPFSEVRRTIPAWSLSALLELMPFHIIENGERYGFYQRKGLNPQGETYCFEYKSNTGERLYETNHLNNPIDAAFEMVVWLKENEKI